MAQQNLDPQHKAAQVNSSYSVFFLLSVIGISFVLTNSTIVPQDQTWLAAIFFALIFYVTWDIIRQLYSPGQTVVLYTLTFIIFPLLLSVTVYEGYFIWVAGWITWLIATITASILELIYEVFFASSTPRNTMKRLLRLDASIDKSLVSLNDKHLSYFNLRGVIVYGLIITGYFAIVSILFT